MAARELPEMPNGPLLELHGQRKRFHVPFGLKPLLEEMTREILRYQPEDIYLFLAQYLETKLANRKNKKSIDSGSFGEAEEAEVSDILGQLQLTKDEADKYATKIQAAFRGFKARRSLGQGDTKRNSKSGKEDEKRWSGGSGEIDEQAVSEIMHILEEKRVEMEAANEAAIKIQSLFRGHKVRKVLKRQSEERESAQKRISGEKEAGNMQDRESEGGGQNAQKSTPNEGSDGN